MQIDIEESRYERVLRNDSLSLRHRKATIRRLAPGNQNRDSNWCPNATLHSVAIPLPGKDCHQKISRYGVYKPRSETV
jgi:hypothetical protein